MRSTPSDKQLEAELDFPANVIARQKQRQQQEQLHAEMQEQLKAWQEEAKAEPVQEPKKKVSPIWTSVALREAKTRFSVKQCSDVQKVKEVAHWCSEAGRFG